MLRFQRGLTASIALLALSAVDVARAQFAVGGVYVDAKGVIRRAETPADGQRLREFATKSLLPSRSTAVNEASELRFVSLARLQRVVAGRPDETRAADVELLAGLTGVKYVYLAPDGTDVVVAGPAEAWTVTETGDVVGVKSRRPTLRLDDLIVALRYAFAESEVDAVIGCSIDPTPEGNRRLTAFTRQLGNVGRGRVSQVVAGMQAAIGLQDVTVYGVPAGTPFASKLVAADYRLKRVAMGHDPPPVPRLSNYLDNLAGGRRLPRSVVQHRFWFTAHCDAIHAARNDTVFELDGVGFRLAAAPVVPGQPTTPGPDRKPHAAAARFVEEFNAKREAITSARPEFAELRNLIGLALVAELIARPHLEVGRDDEARAWMPSGFLDRRTCRIAKTNAPTHVPSLAGVRVTRARQWVVSLSGGVRIDPASLVETSSKPRAETAARLPVLGPPADASRWWWD